MAVDTHARNIATAALKGSGGSSKPVDAYTKAESDAKYELKEDAAYYYNNLSKTINPEDESQTVINIMAANGSYSTIVEVDNFDVVTDVPQHAVMGSLKGQDLDERVTALEKDRPKIYDLTDISQDRKELIKEIIHNSYEEDNNGFVLIDTDLKGSIVAATSVTNIDTMYYFYFHVMAKPNGQIVENGINYIDLGTTYYLVYNEADDSLSELTELPKHYGVSQLAAETQIIGKDNTEEWEPTQQYGLVHKDYVDNAIKESKIPVIEIKSAMTKADRTSHTYPKLTLDQAQINTIINNNTTILKVIYSITDNNNGEETDTLVFYTTIDDNKVVSGANTVHTIKVNAVRTNNEGMIVYHAELVGDGTTYFPSTDLQATYIAHNII